MMGKSHVITGACALEHIYAAGILINRTGIMPIITAKDAVWNYLGGPEIPLLLVPVYLAAYFFGILLPDIDSPDSILGRYVHLHVKHRAWLHAIYLYLLIGALKWIHPLLALGFGKLEGIHHIFASCHPAFAVILVVTGWICPVSAWIFFGSVVHLFWDSLSVCGNCWFYKLFSDYIEYPNGAKVKKGHILKLYRTGEWSEYLVLFIDVVATVVSVILIAR